MTPREEYRAKCIEAMVRARYGNDLDIPGTLGAEFRQAALEMTAKEFDALHDIAFVVPLEVTEEMLEAARNYARNNTTDDLDIAFEEIFLVMAAADNLTNAPESQKQWE